MEIQLKLKNELLKDYLHYCFSITKNGLLKVSSTHNFGRLLIGMYRRCDTPPERLEGSNVVEFTFSISRATQASSTHFVFYSMEDTEKLNQALKAIFEIDLDSYYLQGLRLGLAKKDIIDSFMRSRNLHTLDSADMIQKKTYRADISSLNRRHTYLRKLAWYRNDKIDESLR